MSQSVQKNLNTIYSCQKEIKTLEQIESLLGWDRETYMPEKGITSRSEQASLTGKLLHQKMVSKRLEDAVSRLSSPEIYSSLSEKDRNVVSRLRKDIEKEKKLPTEFVGRYIKATTLASPAWASAREKKDFSIFEPHLEKIISLKKEEIEYRDFPGHPYNSLMDYFEEGMTVENLDSNFRSLRKDIVSLLGDIMGSRKYEKADFSGKYGVKSQKRIANKVMSQMGLSSNRSRLDVSPHPFTTTIGPDDVRITTRYNKDNPLESFSGVMHESGHALFELGMPREYDNTVVQNSASYGLHESQSRFWENVIGRGAPFWNHFFKNFRKEFRGMKNASLDDWLLYVNWVEPSFIRIEADELTYGLHIILRYDIEKGLAEGSIKTEEIPELWNEKMNEYLGIVPENDSEGALQDVHWSHGLFGYFPSYEIGSIYAAQIYDAMKKEMPGLEDDIEKGDFSVINKWLGDKIYRHGRTMSAEEIIEKACGSGLDSSAFMGYLKNKYSEIYDL